MASCSVRKQRSTEKRGKKGRKKKKKVSPRDTGINLKELEWQKLGQAEQQN